MSISITIQGATAEEVHFHVKGLAQVFRKSPVSLPIVEQPEEKKKKASEPVENKEESKNVPEALNEAPEVVRRGRGRPRKEDRGIEKFPEEPASLSSKIESVDDDVATHPSPPVAAPPEPSTSVSLGEVLPKLERKHAIAAAERVTTKHGMKDGVTMVRGLLSRLGCKKFSELTEENYSEFVELCLAAEKQ